MSAYVIYHQIEVTDPDKFAAYRSKIREVLARFGGRVIASDPQPKTLEGEWSGTRNVIIEFPDMAAIERWHHSDEYKPFLTLRRSATRGNVIAVNGL